MLRQAVAFLLLALPAVAQSPVFDAISITPARPGEARTPRLRILPNGDLSASAVPVRLLLRYAYDVPTNPSPRLSRVPDWRDTYDIEATAASTAIPPGLSASEKKRRFQGMIRGVLEDRFKLVMRVEQKRMPVYILTVARGGPNLQKSTIAETDCIVDTGTVDGCHDFIMGRGHSLTARAIDMDDLVQYIENWTDFAGGEPHGIERPVRSEDRRLAPDAAAASPAWLTGRAVRRPPHHLHCAQQTWSRAETAGSHRAGIHSGAPRAAWA